MQQHQSKDFCHGSMHHSLRMSLTPTLLRKISVGTVAAVTSAFVANNALQRFVYRYPRKDPNHQEPLPDGPFPVCPLQRFMDNPRESSPSFGPGVFFYNRSRRLRHLPIWKFLGAKKKGVVIVSGLQNTKTVLNLEFSSIFGQSVPFSSAMTGANSLRYANERKQHSFLRNLVGAGMSAANVASMIPALQQASESVLDGQETKQWKMHEICMDFTLEVATKQIIGLQVSNEEKSVLRQALADWLGLIFDVNNDKALKAQEYILGKIEDRIKQLEGPDGSALAAMVFEKDEESGGNRLTRQQIIDNTQLLIFAGSETSAGTLTLCFLLLGLNPSKYAKLVEEQKHVVNEHGTALSRDVLDKAMPYTDAVVKEALRIRPIVGGAMRGTAETIVVDGKQIPAGWSVTYDRHLTHLLDPVTYKEDESHMDVRKGFQPERWLDAATKPSEFIPFGYGPRYCLGAGLAMTEMKVFLSVVVRRLSSIEMVEPNPTEPILWKERCIVPVPRDGVVIEGPQVIEAPA